MSPEGTAAAWAEGQVASVRDDPAGRLALMQRCYYGPYGEAPRHLPFRRAALSFMQWQLRLGLLQPQFGARPGSPWWRAVNEAERFFMNVVLCRVLYAHALVAAPRIALGRLSPLAPLLGDPQLYEWPLAGRFHRNDERDRRHAGFAEYLSPTTPSLRYWAHFAVRRRLCAGGSVPRREICHDQRASTGRRSMLRALAASPLLLLTPAPIAAAQSTSSLGDTGLGSADLAAGSFGRGAEARRPCSSTT